jgi:hypothetical protein
VAPAAQALGATLVAGSLVNLLPSVDGFRRNTPTLPPLTGLEGETTLAEKVADYINGARVQVGFPVPPPFLPPTVGLGLLATAYGLWDRVRDAAGQLWGLFNSKPSSEGPEGFARYKGEKGKGSISTRVLNADGSLVHSRVLATASGDDEVEIFQDVFYLEGERNFFWRANVYRDGEKVHADLCLALFVGGACKRFSSRGTSVEVRQATGGTFNVLGKQQSPFQPEQPTPGPEPEPEVAPLQSPPPLPLVVPLPASPTEPGKAPQPAPVPQPAPQPAGPGPGVAPAPPAVAPRTPAYPQPTPTQQPTPTGQPTAPDGTLVPLPLPLPRLTPTNSHVVNGTEVPANGPAPTLTGIAQELGRLERKSAQLLDPGRAPTGPNLDRLGQLGDGLGSLLEALFFLTQGGEYGLSSPCELNEAGERVPVVVPFSGALNSFGVLSNKIDALAELLQASKDLKQPICRPKAPIGEPVTVNFEQVN